MINDLASTIYQCIKISMNLPSDFLRFHLKDYSTKGGTLPGWDSLSDGRTQFHPILINLLNRRSIREFFCWFLLSRSFCFFSLFFLDSSRCAATRNSFLSFRGHWHSSSSSSWFFILICRNTCLIVTLKSIGPLDVFTIRIDCHRCLSCYLRSLKILLRIKSRLISFHLIFVLPWIKAWLRLLLQINLLLLRLFLNFLLSIWTPHNTEAIIKWIKS